MSIEIEMSNDKDIKFLEKITGMCGQLILHEMAGVVTRYHLEIARLKEKLEGSESGPIGEAARIEKATLEALKQENSDLVAKIDELHTVVEVLNKKLGEREVTLDGLHDQLQEAHTNRQIVSRELKEAQQFLKDKNLRIDGLTVNLQKKEIERSKSFLRAEENEATIEEKDKVISELNAKIDSLESKYNSVLAEKHVAEKDLSLAAERAEHWQSKADESKEAFRTQYNDFTKQSDDLWAQYEKEQEKVKELEALVKTLQEEIDELKGPDSDYQEPPF